MAQAREIVETWLDAIEQRDRDRIFDLLADDVTLQTERLEQPIVGKEIFREILGPAIGFYETIRIERVEIVASGRDVAVLARTYARFKGDAEIMGTKLPTAGKELSVLSALFIEVNEAGKIARLQRVQDAGSVVRQLGIPAEQLEQLAASFAARIEAMSSPKGTNG